MEKLKANKQQAAPPAGDPYALLQRQYQFVLDKLAQLEQQVLALQMTWDRLLNISNQSDIPRPEYNVWSQPEPEPEVELPAVRHIPIWQQDNPTVPEDTKKKRSTVGTILFIISVLAVLLILISIFLRSQGWTCMFMK